MQLYVKKYVIKHAGEIEPLYWQKDWGWGALNTALMVDQAGQLQLAPLPKAGVIVEVPLSQLAEIEKKR